MLGCNIRRNPENSTRLPLTGPFIATMSYSVFGGDDMHERFMKFLLIGGGGLLLSPLAAFGAWSVFGSLLGSFAIVIITAGWYYALRHFVSRNRPLPVALSWEEEQRRKQVVFVSAE